MKNIKSLVKYIGNILMILGLIFIVKKLLEFEIDYGVIFTSNNIRVLIIITLIYGLNVLFMYIPWSRYLMMITRKDVQSSEIAYIYTKSNLLKYLPGNVFQYIGRNELAVRNNLKHADVGVSTLFEIINQSLAALICVVVFNLNGFLLWFKNSGLDYVIIFLILFVSIIFVTIICRNMIKGYLKKYLYLLSKNNIFNSIGSLCFSFIQHIIFASIYLIILIYIVNAEIQLSNIPIIIGAYLLSWLVGFFTIGSPGGIGVREFVICLLLDGIIMEESILLSIVLFRFLSIFGDILAWGYSVIWFKIFNEKIV